MLDAALWYKEERGFSIIPIKPNKRPYVSWQTYQSRMAPSRRIKQWFGEEYPDAMIGIITGELSNLAVVDIDTEEGARNMLDLIPNSFVCPKAFTPGGGYHLYCQHTPGLRNNARVIPGADLRAEGGYIIAPPSLNQNGTPYRWQEGFAIEETSIPRLPQAYIDYILEHDTYHDAEVFKEQHSRKGVLTFTKGSRDDNLFHVANCLVKGGMERGGVQSVLSRLAESCTPPYPPQDIPIKVSSAISRAVRREGNLSQDVRDWVNRATGEFNISQIYNDLRLQSRPEKKLTSGVLSSLVEEDVIVRQGRRYGIFRKKDKDHRPMEWKTAPNEPLNIEWPLRVQDWAQVYPGNVVVVAGESQAGKTAYLMRLAAINAGKGMDINYLNSEMADQELRKRIELFEDIPLEIWEKIGFFERVDNFADVIQPNAINIVDYLEETNEPFKVANYITQMFKALKSGIVVVAIQKPTGRDWGRGGEATAALARLYLSIFYHQRKDDTPNRLKIVKGKAWATSENPDGKMQRFKLVKGSQFIPIGPWQHDRRRL